MNILFASSSFGGGGMTTFGLELINALSVNNDITVILGDDSKYPIDKSKARVLYYDCKLHTIENAENVIKVINEDVKPELLIASGATLIPIIAPFLSDDIRVVTVSHSNKYLHSDYCAFNHQYLDRIIAASSVYNKEYLEKKFKITDKDKIKVIVNFVDDIENAEEIRKQKKTSKPIQIIFPGSCAAPKTPELALQIAKKLIQTDLDFKFYWTGNTQIPLSKFCSFLGLKEAKQLIPDDPRVVFTGRIPAKEDLDKLVAESHIFLAPSRREGCSMALIEALRDGDIPLVGDYLNSNRVLAKDGYCGFVLDHTNPDSFVEKIRDIIQNTQKYEHMFDNARRVYEEELTFDVWKGQIDDYAVNCHISHKPRYPNIDRKVLNKYIKQFKRLEKSDKWLMFFEESLKVFFYMIRQKKYK